jgi:hypothetical protein
MSDMHFTEDEAHLVDAMARDRHGVMSRLSFYASVLVPVFMIGGYGIINRDFLATDLGLIGLSIFVCWNLMHESKYVGLYKSIFQKVAQHQRERESVAQQAAAGDAGNPRA